MRCEAKAQSMAGRPTQACTARSARLPPAFLAWFNRRGWHPRAHQLGLLANVAQRRSTLLIAPTGAGKTLAGFLPSLVALTGCPRPAGGHSIHTLYVSPLKALTSDIARNLMAPLTEWVYPLRSKRARATRQLHASNDNVGAHPTCC